MHLYQVLTYFNIRSDIYAEGIIAVSPIACTFSVYEDCRFAHRTVEVKHGVRQLGNVNPTTIMSLAYPGQGTRTARLLCSLLLAVLLNGHALQVPFLVERSVNSPVVRYADLLPVFSITGKFPILKVHRSCNGILCPDDTRYTTHKQQ